MSALELILAVGNKAAQVKKDLTKSYFGGNKEYFTQILLKYPFCKVEGDVYETINNLSAKVAHNTEY